MVLLAAVGYTAASGDWFQTAVLAAGKRACLALANVRESPKELAEATYFGRVAVERISVARTARLGSFHTPVAPVESLLASSWAQSGLGSGSH